MQPCAKKFEGQIREHVLYYLTNVTVKDNVKRYRATTNAFRIYFTPITEVVGVVDKSFPDSIYYFKTIPEIELMSNIDDVGMFGMLILL